jgi:hypothetical protein
LKTETVHKTTIISKCPHGANDVYEAEFHISGSRTIPVEDIESAISNKTSSPIYQEDLTLALAMIFKCKVVTTGRHGNFTTRCSSEPSGSPE